MKVLIGFAVFVLGGCVTVNNPTDKTESSTSSSGGMQDQGGGGDGGGNSSSSSSMTNSGGSGAGGNECQPTTCETEKKNCGKIDNGCGKKLNCGTCSEAYQVCGEAPVDQSGVPNVCGGGCIDDGGLCKDGRHHFICNVAGPKTTFLTYCNPDPEYGDTTPAQFWCCD